MTSSIFYCIAAAFIALPTAIAQPGNWDINYQSPMITNFAHTATNEIIMSYQIGAGRAFQIDLFDKGCVEAVAGITIETTTERTAGADADPVLAEHDQLDIMLNFDKAEIASSNIWTSPDKLEFCVRVQLLSGTEVIKEE